MLTNVVSCFTIRHHCPVAKKGKNFFKVRGGFYKKNENRMCGYALGLLLLCSLFMACYQLIDEFPLAAQDTEESSEPEGEVSETAESAGENQKTEEPEYKEVLAIQPKDSSLTKTYKKLVGLELSYAEKGVEIEGSPCMNWAMCWASSMNISGTIGTSGSL
jgi:hypothetical protein